MILCHPHVQGPHPPPPPSSLVAVGHCEDDSMYDFQLCNINKYKWVF